MEEDIKILETFRYRQKTKNYNKITLEDIQAIENLIVRNKELESALDNSVSKDEIKELLEQIDKKEEKEINAYGYSYLGVVKTYLQELLNKGE